MRTLLSILGFSSLLLITACGPEDQRPETQIKAEKGDPAAQFEWAKTIEASAPDDIQSLTTAAQWYKRAGEAGIELAQERRALILASGKLGTPLAEQGAKILADAPALETADAKTALAVILEEGALLPRDNARATTLRRSAAQMGHTASMRVLAKSILASDPPPGYAEKREATAWLTKAADTGDPESQYELGALLDQSGEKAEAEKRYLEAAKQQHPHGMLKAGQAYLRSGRHPTYGALAFEYLSKAFEAGIPESVLSLSFCYTKGIGVDKNEKKAEELGFLALAIRDNTALLETLAQAFKQNQWDPFESADVAAFLDRITDLKSNIRNAISERLPTRDALFERLVEYRTANLDLLERQFLSSSHPESAPISEEEKASPTQRYAARYGEHANLFEDAVKSNLSDKFYELGTIHLDKSSPLHNLDEAVFFFRKAHNEGHPAASFALYQLSENHEAYRVDPAQSSAYLERAAASIPDAALTLAEQLIRKETYEGDALALSLLSPFVTKENETARALAKSIIEKERVTDPEFEWILELTDELAKEFPERFAYRSARHYINRFEKREEVVGLFNPELIRYNIDIATRSKSAIAPTSLKKDPFQAAQSIGPDKLPDVIREKVSLIKDLADSGHLKAIEDLSAWTFYGAYVPQDQDASMLLWKNASEQTGSPTCDFLYGWSLMRGYKNDQDLTQAARLIYSCSSSFRSAREQFSEFNERITGPNGSIMDIAYRAGALENADAMLQLSRHYKNRRKTKVDDSDEQSWRWLAEAAKAGSADAAVEIGISYFKGSGVEKNLLRGIRYLEQGAQLGNKEAQYLAGFFYATGTEIPRDLEKGLSFLKAAADQGYIKATNLIASLEAANVQASDDSPEKSGLFNAFISSAINQDYFPIKPTVLIGGELKTIIDSKNNSPIYLESDRPKSASNKTPHIFLAAEQFSDSSIRIDNIRLAAPLVFTPNGVIFTGQEPSVSFECATTKQATNSSCLLIVKDRNGDFHHYWKRIGDLSPDKPAKIKIKVDQPFYSNRNLAIYFFSEGLEMPSNARRQVHYFLDDKLSAFTQMRDTQQQLNVDDARDPSLFSSIHPSLYTKAIMNGPASAQFEISELGFIKDLRFEAQLDTKDRDEIISILAQSTFMPRISSGKPVATKVSIQF